MPVCVCMCPPERRPPGGARARGPAGSVPVCMGMCPPERRPPGGARVLEPAGSVPVYIYIYVRMLTPGGEAQEGQRRPAGRQSTEPTGWKEKEREAA